MIQARRTALILSLLGLSGLCLGSFAQDRVRVVIGTQNNECRIVNTYPEYWVDGRPFFEHAAAFFYHRIPRDRWGEELLHFKEMGINTIDLYPFWNWHEPEEGVLDFDGHTNPQRDLRFLLRLIDSMGFKITLRPGPYFTGEWRNGGYPDWLMRKPGFGMSEQTILDGRYPGFRLCSGTNRTKQRGMVGQPDSPHLYTQVVSRPSGVFFLFICGRPWAAD